MNSLRDKYLTLLCKGEIELIESDAQRVQGDFSWCRYGIRDPSVLARPDGKPVIDSNGHIRLYFNGRDRDILDGGVTQVGLFTGSQNDGWNMFPDPVFMDGSYAAQGSVLEISRDCYRMYYSPDTKVGFSLATSCDGIKWERFSNDLILQTSQFHLNRMGLPYVQFIGGRWTMVFEGIDNGKFHLYIAFSDDGINWVPGNASQPIYIADESAWDSAGQANPSLVASENDGTFYIFYNGCSYPGEWEIGILVSRAVEGEWSSSNKSLLKRGKAGSWNQGRIEGARFIEYEKKSFGIVYFGLPSENSYANGQISFVNLSTHENMKTLKTGHNKNIAAERKFNDLLALKYFDIWDTYPIQLFTTQVESNFLSDMIPDNSSVLLLGSGGGRELPILLRKGCKITAVDISPGMLEIGKKRYPQAAIEWVEADLHWLPKDLQKFDSAVCLGAVFNYLRDPILFFQNLKSALKPTASLILSVINAEHPSEKKKYTILSDGRIRTLYNLSDIQQYLSECGFEIITNYGIRFFADLVPSEWNRENSEHLKLLQELLVLEKKWINVLPAKAGKFLFIEAKVTD